MAALRLCAAYTLVVCFMLRSLVPAGFMPDFSAAAAGKLQIIICSAQGAKAVTIDLAGNGSHEQGSKHGHETCPFAAASIAGYAPTAPLLVSAFDFSAAPTVGLQEVALSVRRIGPPLGSRGPPA